MIILILKWFALFIVDLFLNIFINWWFIWIYSLFTADNKWPNWGGWFQTYDNPPNGDEGYREKRAIYIPEAKGAWQKYRNRVEWIQRNPLYGFNDDAGIPYSPSYLVSVTGDENISDKYARPGSKFAKCTNTSGKVVAFEYYLVKPWGNKGKCLRIKIGWKITTDKFGTEWDFAPFVDTIQPFKAYGENVK